MKKMKNTALLRMLILSVMAMLVLAGCHTKEGTITEVPADDTYSFVNPEVLKAEPDVGMVIDGVLDEEVYQNNNWLYLHNEDGGNNVDIAMTSYFGEQGMYFVYDVTESVPIYVNPNRSPVLNSCIEMYLAPSYLTGVTQNSIFEIDLMPTGDMSFRKSNGSYGYINVATTNENMAVLGATTKGGEVNTPECYGYCLELFIPWNYMTWLDIDVDAIRNSFVYVNPAHITSNNYDGTNVDLDRYWYYYAQQQGADFSNVFQYFRFNADGIIGTVPVTAKDGDNYTVSAPKTAMPGMVSHITVTPEEGYALTSILVNGEEQIQNVSYNKDGSVTVEVRGTDEGITVSAKAEPVAEGNKTLSGKITIHSMAGGDLKDVLAYYAGPTGEKPLDFDSNGNFEQKDLKPGYYTIKVEKEGCTSITRGIYLDRDIYTELTLEYEMFRPTYGACWILDEQNEGILQKFGGTGQIMTQQQYNNFTFSANLKYDDDLAKQGNTDYFTQQRSGMRIMFSNGKYWHINLLKENDKYILQYGKQTGDASLFNWKTIHTLTSAEAAQYRSEDGIRLQIMRQGRYAAVWLGNKLLVIEKLSDQYASYTAQLGMEAWVANRTIMEIPYSISASVPVNVAGSPFHWPAEIWDISNQYKGTVTKYPAPGKDTWLDTQIDCNDVTTICKDLSPENKDFCMVYIFKFSNGESFRLRLNHTDDDGKFRVQSFAGSTLSPVWKNYYTLTDEQAQKAVTDGVAYRVQILGTTAYVYIDGVQVCTVDLSSNVNTGNPSGVENATVRVSFRLDGNTVGNTVIPFKLENNSKSVIINIAETENGMITAEKTGYKLGDTVKLTVTGAEGYYYSNLSIDGTPVMPDWDGTYSFTADKNVYNITGTFDSGVLAENSEGTWNLLKQNMGVLLMESHGSGNSGWLEATVDANDISAFIRDAAPEAKNFSMIYHFAFSNGEALRLRLNHTDNDDKYRVQVMSGSTVSSAWKNHYTLTEDQQAKVEGDGLNFRVVIQGTNAVAFLDDTAVCTLDLSKVVATGAPSGIENATVRVKLLIEGNLDQEMEIPFALVDSTKRVEIHIAEMTNGTVVPNRNSYNAGDTVTLTVTPDAGYSQKLYINGEPLLLDWKTNQYSFVTKEDVYDITGSFEKSLALTASDGNRFDAANQAHGVLKTYYPDNNDSWWMDIKGEYKSITVKAKNYKAVADSQDGNGKVGFATILRVTMDNGSSYAFRVINDKGTYAYDRYGSGGSLTGWGNWKNLSSLADQFNGDGVAFKLERTGDNVLTLSVDGTVMETYTMAGITAGNKVASVSVQHNGNKGEMVAIPFVLTKPGDTDSVKLNIADLTGGSVTAGQASYHVGDTVILTVAPNAGYSQKLYIDGEPLLLDWKTSQHSFVAEKDTYDITGSFEPSLQENPSDAGRWDSSNQAHGIISTYYPGNNDSWWYVLDGEYTSIAVMAKNYKAVADSQDGNGKVGFATILRVTMDNGNSYAFRVINDKGTYAYDRYGSGGSLTGWGSWKNLSSLADQFNGDGVAFKLERTGDNMLTLSVDGTVMETYTMAGITAGNKVASVSIQHNGNQGEMVDIPFVLTKPGDADEVALNIADFANGTVTPDKAKYALGDTVTLTVAPDAGYSQKLYIDGEPLLLDWKTSQYSFVAEKDTYDITGSFEPSLQENPSDAGRWDSSNQAHGIISTYYPGNNDSWWYKINGNYDSIAVNAKNYLPQADSAEGSGKIGYAFTLAVTMDNGKSYGFRIINERENGNGDPRYIYTRFGASGCVTGWGGWCLLEAKAPGITEKIQGDGAEFKLTRTGANTLQITLDGVVLDTYTMDGVTAANKVTSVGIYHYGNKGQTVQIPIVLAPVPDSKKLG